MTDNMAACFTPSSTWERHFCHQTDPFEGCVSSVGDVKSLITDFERQTCSKFRSVKNDALFGKESDIVWSDGKFVVRWEDTQNNAVPAIPSHAIDGIPFIIVGKKLLECHHGIDRDKKKKLSRQKENLKKHDHDYRKKRFHVQNTKKKNCPARIRIRHVIRLPEYKVSSKFSKAERNRLSVQIKNGLRNGAQLMMEHRYYISLPTADEHRDHVRGEAAGLIQSIDDNLKEVIHNMVVHHNVTSTVQMRLLLEVHLQQTMFKDQPLPPRTNKRFWPAFKDIHNHMLLTMMRLRCSNVDQANVQQLIAGWKKAKPEDQFYLQLKEDFPNTENSGICEPPQSDADGTGGDDDLTLRDRETELLYGARRKFLYVHQTPWQKRLLQRYGNEICLLDATYRTTRYALPVFFLCVPTNVNYITVATFILETEDCESIKEPLLILKAWNPEWKPRFFMCDYAKEEITALEEVFPGSLVYLCDFHREQAWERWLSAAHNGVHGSKSEILTLLRAIAQATSTMEYDSATTILKNSKFWTKIKKWFEEYWLRKHERWVRAFRQDRFNVSINTNNGVERQNLSLKYEYLEMKKAKSLSHLLGVITDKFLPDSYIKYLKMNLSASEQSRAYSDAIPLVLRNRPRPVVHHCFVRWEEGLRIQPCDVEKVGDGIFLVKSQTNHPVVYTVNFQPSDVHIPSCECADWKMHHLPCKHFMSIFNLYPAFGWDALPSWYRESPFLNLDLESFPSATINTEEQPYPITEEDQEDSQLDIPEASASLPQLPLPNSTQLKRERSKISGLCQILKDWTYKCRDVSKLQYITEQLTTTLAWFRPALPQSDQFLLEEGDMTHIGTTPAKKKAPKPSCQKKKHRRRSWQFLPLPLVPSKKKGVGRYGLGAANLRKGHLEKGIVVTTDGAGAKQVRKRHMNKGGRMVANRAGVQKLQKGCIDKTISNMFSEADGCRSHAVGEVGSSVYKKVAAMINEMDNEQWDQLKQKAVQSTREDMLIHSRRAAAALSHLGDEEEDHLLHFMKEKSGLGIKAIDLMFLILSELVTCGQIALNVHPEQLDEEANEAMKDLLSSFTSNAEDSEGNHNIRQDGLSATKEAAEATQCESGKRNVNGIRWSGKRKSVSSDETTVAQKQRKSSDDGKVKKPKKSVHFAPNTKKDIHLAEMSNPCPLSGLSNPVGRNLCFANSLLQCLRIADLHRLLLLHPVCSNDGEGCFLCQLSVFFQEGPASAEHLCTSITSFWKEYKVGVQQDSHELWQNIMQLIWKTCFDGCDKDADAERLFFGIQESKVKCKACLSVSSILEPFTDLSLPVTQTNSIPQALEQFFVPEDVEYKCSRCSNDKCVKETRLSRIPKHLVLHLKRFSGSLRKISRHIDFEEELRLTGFVDTSQEHEEKARLFAVICHQGKTLNRGHYYSFVCFGMQWYRIDDLKTRKVTFNCVQKCNDEAYLLFYKTLPRPYIN